MHVRVRIPEKSRVFLLEDSDHRIKWFRERLPNIVVATNVEDAIKILSEAVFDFVFLDHDLQLVDYQSYKESRTGTGRDVAKFLSGTGFVGKNVFIHSWNSMGAAAMKDCLAGAYAIPFGQFEIEIV